MAEKVNNRSLIDRLKDSSLDANGIAAALDVVGFRDEPEQIEAIDFCIEKLKDFIQNGTEKSRSEVEQLNDYLYERGLNNLEIRAEESEAQRKLEGLILISERSKHHEDKEVKVETEEKPVDNSEAVAMAVKDETEPKLNVVEKIDAERLQKQSKFVEELRDLNHLDEEIAKKQERFRLLKSEIPTKQQEALDALADEDNGAINPKNPPLVQARIVDSLNKKSQEVNPLLEEFKELEIALADLKKKQEESEAETTLNLENILSEAIDFYSVDSLLKTINKTVEDSSTKHKYANLCTRRRIGLMQEDRERAKKILAEEEQKGKGLDDFDLGEAPKGLDKIEGNAFSLDQDDKKDAVNTISSKYDLPDNFKSVDLSKENEDSKEVKTSPKMTEWVKFDASGNTVAQEGGSYEEDEAFPAMMEAISAERQSKLEKIRERLSHIKKSEVESSEEEKKKTEKKSTKANEIQAQLEKNKIAEAEAHKEKLDEVLNPEDKAQKTDKKEQVTEEPEGSSHDLAEEAVFEMAEEPKVENVLDEIEKSDLKTAPSEDKIEPEIGPVTAEESAPVASEEPEIKTEVEPKPEPIEEKVEETEKRDKLQETSDEKQEMVDKEKGIAELKPEPVGPTVDLVVEPDKAETGDKEQGTSDSKSELVETIDESTSADKPVEKIVAEETAPAAAPLDEVTIDKEVNDTPPAYLKEPLLPSNHRNVKEREKAASHSLKSFYDLIVGKKEVTSDVVNQVLAQKDGIETKENEK